MGNMGGPMKQGPILENLGVILTNLITNNQISDVITRLQTTEPLTQIGQQLGLFTSQEQTHLEAEWFNPNSGIVWWSLLQPVEPILRYGLIEAIKKADELGVPIEFFWNSEGETFEVYIDWNVRQVAVIIFTPQVPVDGQLPPAQKPSALTSPTTVMLHDEPIVAVKRISPGVAFSPDVQLLQEERDGQGQLKGLLVCERLKSENQD